MLSVVMPSTVLLNFIRLIVIMLSADMFNVPMLKAIAKYCYVACLGASTKHTHYLYSGKARYGIKDRW
jgi:hypothetical protein